MIFVRNALMTRTAREMRSSPGRRESARSHATVAESDLYLRLPVAYEASSLQNDEHVGVQERVAKEGGVAEGGGDIVLQALVAVVWIREGGGEAGKELSPREANHECLTDFDEEEAAVCVPGICGCLGVGATEALGSEDVLAVAEDAACIIGIAVGSGGGVPVRPLLPVIVGEEGAAAPKGEGMVEPGTEDCANRWELLGGAELGWQLVNGGEGKALRLHGSGGGGNGHGI